MPRRSVQTELQKLGFGITETSDGGTAYRIPLAGGACGLLVAEGAAAPDRFSHPVRLHIMLRDDQDEPDLSLGFYDVVSFLVAMRSGSNW